MGPHYPFKEEERGTTIEFLDLNISLGTESGISIRPRLRTKRYLAKRSAHEPNTHTAWPVAFATRLVQLSTFQRDANASLNALASALHAQFGPQMNPVTDLCRVFDVRCCVSLSLSLATSTLFLLCLDVVWVLGVRLRCHINKAVRFR